MTVSRRILVHVALGAAIVIAIVAAVTYGRVFEAAEQRALEHLETYVTERMRREEAGFQIAYSHLEVARGLFLARESMPVPADIQAQWNALIRRDPDGGWRSDRAAGDPSLWGHRDLPVPARTQHRLLSALAVSRELMPTWERSFPSLYFSFPGSAVIGFNPDQLEWAWETPSDYPVEEQEWYLAARPENNPEGGFVWTAIYPDPTSGLPFATLMLPIQRDGEFICTLAHDMHLERLFTEVTRSEFRGATHLILRGDGRIIAHPEMRDAILASGGELTAQTAGDPALANLHTLMQTGAAPRISGFEPVSQSYFIAARLQLPGADWRFVTTMPRSVVQRQAVQAAQWVWLSGLISLLLLLGAIQLILRWQVRRPLGELTQAARVLSAGAGAVPTLSPRADELGELAAAFREMNARVLARENELRQLNTDLERRVAERTTELADANRRLAEALRAEKELGELRANFVSLVSHEFRTPLEIILTSSDILDRYLDRLPEEKRAHYLRTIHESVKRMSGMMEDVLLLGKVEAGKLQFQSRPLDLPQFCRRVADEMLSATARRCPVELELADDLDGAHGDESLLRHVFANLLSNAAKYSPPGTPVTLRLTRAGENAILVITDRGRGIPVADRARLFQSFQRGSNVSDTPGTGLGLLIVKKCVEIHRGHITLDSIEGRGTTFTVSLPLFQPPAPVNEEPHTEEYHL